MFECIDIPDLTGSFTPLWFHTVVYLAVRVVRAYRVDSVAGGRRYSPDSAVPCFAPSLRFSDLMVKDLLTQVNRISS